MFLVQCNGCHTSAFADCQCEGLGHDPSVAMRHHPECQMADVGASVACPPGSGCCQEDHSHDGNANACPGIEAGHAGEACPHPDPLACAHDPDVAADPEATCPGGHCGGGVKGCQVCRAVTITVMPGTIELPLSNFVGS